MVESDQSIWLNNKEIQNKDFGGYESKMRETKHYFEFDIKLFWNF